MFKKNILGLIIFLVSSIIELGIIFFTDISEKDIILSFISLTILLAIGAKLILLDEDA